MPEKVYLKIHRSGDSEVIAICDPSLIGRTIKGDRKKLKISEKFYRGMLVPNHEAIRSIQAGQNINLVGSIVNTLLDKKFINEEAVLWFNDEEKGKKSLMF